MHCKNSMVSAAKHDVLLRNTTLVANVHFCAPRCSLAVTSAHFCISHSYFITPVDDRHDQEEIYSQRIKAGKRSYFFDVKATRGQDYYLTITESKRRQHEGEDRVSYEKHKLFLYKEDFLKFAEALQDAIAYVREELLTPDEVAELDRPRPTYDERERPAYTAPSPAFDPNRSDDNY